LAAEWRGTGGEMEHLAQFDAASDQLVACSLDVGDAKE
jgi:hypothetical protein